MLVSQLLMKIPDKYFDVCTKIQSFHYKDIQAKMKGKSRGRKIKTSRMQLHIINWRQLTMFISMQLKQFSWQKTAIKKPNVAVAH